ALVERAVAKRGLVLVGSRDLEKSATSHGITLERPVRSQQLSKNRFAVEGTPADCVIAALMQILNEPPSIVVAGVNCGSNIGSDILYSGTVAAATEARLQGIPAIA